MSLDVAISAASGWALIAAGLALGIRHIVLSPRIETWPDAPGWLRECMFALMCAMYVRGIVILLSANTPNGHVPLSGFVVAMIWAAYQVGMAWNIVRQHYRRDVWRRLKRINALADCGRGGVLALLASEGWRVVTGKPPHPGLVE